MKEVIIDTCVLVDLFLSTRDRHQKAAKLAEYLIREGVRVTVPMHVMFELAAAMKHEKLSSPRKPMKYAVQFDEQHPLPVNTIPIDEDFVHTYIDPDLPYLKAGDLIIVAVAKKHGVPLITEDQRQAIRAREAGVSVFSIQEYLDTYARSD